MVMSSSVDGKRTKLMERVNISTWMVQSMKETGKMINNTERVLKNGQMALVMKVIT